MGSIRRIAAVSAVGAALAVAGATAATAQAAATTTTPAAATSQHGEGLSMKIVGFNPAIAKAHGYEIRTDAQGRQYSVKIGAKGAAAAVTPDNSLSGNCGTSYVWYSAIGNQAATLDTGFSGLPEPAIAYTWKVSVTDAVGTGVVSWSGGLALRASWEGTSVTHHSTTGYSYAKVTTGLVTLDDGTYCATLQPSASTTLY